MKEIKTKIVVDVIFLIILILWVIWKKVTGTDVSTIIYGMIGGLVGMLITNLREMKKEGKNK